MTSFLRLPAVLARTGLGRSTLYRMIQRGELPAPVKIGPAVSAWCDDEVDAWAEARRAERDGREPTADQAGRKARAQPGGG